MGNQNLKNQGGAVTGARAMTHPRGCHDAACDQAINQALKKLSKRCEFVANRRPCYSRARIAGKNNPSKWSHRAWLEWVGSGTTLEKISLKTR